MPNIAGKAERSSPALQAAGAALVELTRSEDTKRLSLRTFAVMLLLSSGERLDLQGLANRMGIHKSSAWRIIQTMIDLGWVDWAPLEFVTLTPVGAAFMQPFTSRLQ